MVFMQTTGVMQRTPTPTNATQIGTIVGPMVSMLKTTMTAAIAQTPGRDMSGKPHATTSVMDVGRMSIKMFFPNHVLVGDIRKVAEDTKTIFKGTDTCDGQGRST
jgi:hypothetical protein